MDKQQASKYFNTYFQNNTEGQNLTANRRVAVCGISQGGRNRNLRAISGSYYEPTVNPRTMEGFYNMLAKYGAENQYNKRDLFNCAEAHLWVMLIDLLQDPKKVDVFVCRKVNGRAKKDSPCLNCQQWARNEFKSLNPI